MLSAQLSAKISEFKGLQKLAFQVLSSHKQARVNKNALVFLMWQSKFGGSSSQFISDFINGKFKIESYTRAARKVVEVHPELGNPDRKKLEKEFKFVVKESDTDPNQIEIEFGGLG